MGKGTQYYVPRGGPEPSRSTSASRAFRAISSIGVRIPMARIAQLSSSRSRTRRSGTPARWRRRSLREAGRPLRLTLTENRSVLLSFRRKAGVIHLRLHRMFLHAPLAVVRAVARCAAPHEPQRGRRGAALHEREPAPRAQGAAAAAAAPHRAGASTTCSRCSTA